jgi:hypothetical protein
MSGDSHLNEQGSLVLQSSSGGAVERESTFLNQDIYHRC